MSVYKLEPEKLARDKRKRFFRYFDRMPGDYYIIGGEQPASPEEDSETAGDLTIIALIADGQFLHYSRPKTEEAKEFYFRRKIEFADVVDFFKGMEIPRSEPGAEVKEKKTAKAAKKVVKTKDGGKEKTDKSAKTVAAVESSAATPKAATKEAKVSKEAKAKTEAKVKETKSGKVAGKTAAPAAKSAKTAKKAQPAPQAAKKDEPKAEEPVKSAFFGKISDAKIAAIKKCRADGMTIKATAEKVGVSESSVRKYSK